MAPHPRYVVLLAPLSMLLLSALRCWQFISEYCSMIDWTFANPTNFVSLDLDSYSCEHGYTIELLSIDPLVIYLNDFVSISEIQYLLALGQDRFIKSQVTYGTGEHLNLTGRRSQTAFLPEKDIVCRCLKERMKSLLGNVQHEEVESLQLVKYAQGGDNYRLHTDWTDMPRNNTFDSDGAVRLSRRLGSIFVYLEDNCTRGETYFPKLTSVAESADGDKFAITEAGTGLLIKPRRGSGVFWNNLYANGSGDVRVAHAGLQIESGIKIGLNMWSTYFLDLPMVGSR